MSGENDQTDGAQAAVRIRISMEAGQYGRTLLVLAREECA